MAEKQETDIYAEPQKLKKSSTDTALFKRQEQATDFRSRKSKSVCDLKDVNLDTHLQNEIEEIAEAEEHLCWFHGDISSSTAAERLRTVVNEQRLSKKKREAAFLVRKKERGVYYVLSVLVPGAELVDMVITEDAQGIYSVGEFHRVQGLECLIHDYTGAEREVSGMTVHLKHFAKGTPPPPTTRKYGHTTSLHLAVNEGDADLVKRILEHQHRPDIDAKDSRGSTALHTAANNGQDKIMKMLLDAGAFIDMRAMNGRTALHEACMKNHASTVKLLVELGQADPDSQCTLLGWTPLHIAVSLGATDCITALFELGANPRVQSFSKETPRDLASKLSRSDLIQLMDRLQKDKEPDRDNSDDNEDPNYVNTSVEVRRGIQRRGASKRRTLSVRTEPLYQWITTQEILQCTSHFLHSAGNTRKDRDILNDVERVLERSSSNIGRQTVCEESLKRRRKVIRDVFSQSGTLCRSLWCQMPEVIDSGLPDSIDTHEKELQEAMFEILSSEASYQRSLLVLKNVFMEAPEFCGADLPKSGKCLVSKQDYQALFCNIQDIQKSSAEFLIDLENRWRQSFVMNDICDIISDHAQKKFHHYIRYCSNQMFQEKTLKRLQKQSQFAQVLDDLERSPACQSLSLSSFLLLPMQRVTRLPLLVDAVLKRLNPGSPRHASASQTLAHLKDLAKKCDEGARKMQNAEEMLLLRKDFRFEKIREFPLVSASRSFVKKGQMKIIVLQGGNRSLSLLGLTGPKTTVLDVFLFTDVLVLTRKSGDKYHVENWCLRDKVDVHDATTMSWLVDVTGHLFILSLNCNHKGEKEELLMSVDSESEFTRWMEALSATRRSSRHSQSNAEGDLLVECTRRYIAQETDAITLELAEVVTVLRKTDDGWYWGERIRDGHRGWFPAQNTEIIANEQVRQHYLQMKERVSSQMKQHSETAETVAVKKPGSDKDVDDSTC